MGIEREATLGIIYRRVETDKLYILFPTNKACLNGKYLSMELNLFSHLQI